MNNYTEQYEKYKNYKVPDIGLVFNHPTERLNTPKYGTHSIRYRVLKYENDKGLVETVHTSSQKWKTLHWIRKVYNTP